jgi:hypothetical protein
MAITSGDGPLAWTACTRRLRGQVSGRSGSRLGSRTGQGRATTGTRSYCGTIGMRIQALGAYFCRRTFLRWGECAVSWSVCASTARGSFMARWVAWAWAEVGGGGMKVSEHAQCTAARRPPRWNATSATTPHGRRGCCGHSATLPFLLSTILPGYLESVPPCAVLLHRHQLTRCPRLGPSRLARTPRDCVTT